METQKQIESAILGSALINPIVLNQLIEFGLKASEFKNSANAAIWKQIVELHGMNEPVDIVTVSYMLDYRGVLNDVGGRQYVTDLALSIQTTNNAVRYAQLLRSYPQTDVTISE